MRSSKKSLPSKRSAIAADSPPAVASNVGNTGAQLIEAALAEFNEQGFSGTDTNRIARRAGFAPQTFYRWFKDKIEIFVLAYGIWEDIEQTAMHELLARKATTKQLVDVVVKHHRDYKVFRRSLRQLSLEDAVVRRARAVSRKRQIARIQSWRQEFKHGSLPDESSVAVTLLQMERLADALAEGEFEDMELGQAAGKSALAKLIESLRG
jgi:AcrR family transcriptional regulator